MTSNDRAKEAEFYRSIGWSVMPLWPRSKKPLLSSWGEYQKRLPTEEEVRQWWTRWPEANIAVITGSISGLVALDIDAKHGRSSKELRERGYHVPPTVCARTGGGGEHLLFRHPSVPVKNFAGDRLGPGIDLKGDGGYIVAAPSQHESGNHYEWVVPPVERDGMADVPAWLLDLVHEDAGDWRSLVVQDATEGTRNVRAVKIAGGLLATTPPERWHDVYRQLEDWNARHCKPPLRAEEIHGLFESLKKRESSKPRSTYSVPPVKARALLTRMADVEPQPITWLWPGRIALGKLTLVAGDPGFGKSLLTVDLAARISTGATWPGSTDVAPLGDTVFLSLEDDPADTIRPRLDAAGADCTRVHILHAIEEDGARKRTPSLKRDLKTLEEALVQLPQCRLVVVDPISAYLDDIDSHKNADVRGLLAPFAEMAARLKVAVVMVQHLNKGNVGTKALYRPMGSLAFIAAARSAFIVTKDKDNKDRRLMLPAKNNIAKDTAGMAYSIAAADNGMPRITWDTTPVSMTADEALATSVVTEEQGDRDWAVFFLSDLLSKGPVMARDAIKQAKQAGVSEKMLRRAREKLAVKPMRREDGWVWALPSEDVQGAQDASVDNEGALGIVTGLDPDYAR